MSEIEHEYTKEVVCPHCGHTHGDSWERRMADGDEQTAQCEKCNGWFVITAYVPDTEYSTEKVTNPAKESA